MASDPPPQPARDTTTETVDSPAQSSGHPARASGETAISPVSAPNQPTRAAEEEEAPPPPLPTRPTESAHARHHPHQPPAHPQQTPYVPYPHYPTPPCPAVQTARVLPPMTQRYVATKLGLTVLSSILGIIIIALSCIFLSARGPAEFVYMYALPIVVAAIVWNTAELITYCVRLRRETQRGIHPGAHVALHLLFWLACALAVLLTVTIFTSSRSQVESCRRYYEDDDEDVSYYNGGYSRYYCDDLSTKSLRDYYEWNYLPILRALIAMFCLATLNHFALFVLACIDTHRRNLMRPAGMVFPPQPMPMPAMYYGPPGPPPPGMVPYYPMGMMPPQQAHMPWAPAPYPVPMSGAQEPNSQGKGPAQAHNYQSLAGFYGPASAPAPAPWAAPGHAPAPVQHHASAAAESSSNEKTASQEVRQA
ncbi:hypothetical protein F4778DRAFT_334406 [Xylariomycetidae sp. FL2044]|nr:hypothetical protein F4778DRAFT_334406 [Xylariomycetidae sp. FL2044]